MWCLPEQVLSFSHLSRDLKNCNEFIACGREALPLEMQYENPAAGVGGTGEGKGGEGGGRGMGGEGPTRRRAPTPYHARALQGINNNRSKKGSQCVFTLHGK